VGTERDYRVFIGQPSQYDRLGATQFNLLTLAGLREHHSMLDIGCGSLRAGRLFITYLQPERYFGIEPEEWLMKRGITEEVGHDVIDLKRPRFATNDNFDLGIFDSTFDYLLAHSVFTHAPANQVLSCLRSAAAVTHDRSLFFATFHLGTSDYRGDEWSYPELVPYTTTFIRRGAAEAGLKTRRLSWPHVHHQTWFAFARAGSALVDADPIRSLGRQSRHVRLAHSRLGKLVAGRR
jgi:SAM-dependent methyltransferase